MDKQTPAEAGKKGGITKWARIPKDQRAEIMRKVANARHKKNENLPE